MLSAKDGDSRLMVECADCSVDEGGKTNEVKKIYGKDTEADTEIAEDDVPMESNSSDVKSVETNNDKAVYIIWSNIIICTYNCDIDNRLLYEKKDERKERQ